LFYAFGKGTGLLYWAVERFDPSSERSSVVIKLTVKLTIKPVVAEVFECLYMGRLWIPIFYYSATSDIND
jgi:hypothetical protein